jgi:methanogenic corrinoid protein MtbC1
MASVSGNLSFNPAWNARKERRKPASASSQPKASHIAPTIQPADFPDDVALMLEQMVIPRLLAGHMGDVRSQPVSLTASTAAPHPLITSVDIDALTDLTLGVEADGALSFVDQFLQSGHSVETIYVELLAPAARRLGDYWDSDREDFVAVTMALWRIQEVLRELSARIPAQSGQSAHGRRALFSAMPGDQHSFGTLMIAECFERAGWQADTLIEPDRPELIGQLSSRRYDLIGLTVTADCSSATLAALVTTIRTVSRNPKVKIFVGGRTINQQPGLIEACGADGTAPDAMSAVMLANDLVPISQTGAVHSL